MSDTGCDLGLAQKNDIVQEISAHGKGQPVVKTNAATQGIREALEFLHLDRVTSIQAGFHRRATLHRDPNNARFGPLGFDRACHTRGEATTGKLN